jgi:hypothetical protein
MTRGPNNEACQKPARKQGQRTTQSPIGSSNNPRQFSLIKIDREWGPPSRSGF